MSEFLSKTFGLEGRRALVTGGGRGIGRAVVLALGGAGASVAVHYNRDRDSAEEVVQQLRAMGREAWTLSADVADVKAADAMVSQVRERWGALDILINNAGDLIGRKKFVDTDEATVRRMLDVNLLGTIHVTRAAIPLLERGQSPVIVNLSSMSAHNGGLGGVSLYATTKGGLLTLTRSLARELGPTIRVNALAPGIIVTDLQREHTTSDNLAALEKQTPLRRNGTPEECAGPVVFLCSSAASFITGECVEINGGLWLA